MPQPWVVKPLVLPVGTKKYTVQPVSYQDGLTLIDIYNGQSDEVTDKSKDEDLFKLCMGATFDEMVADRCPYPVMFRAGSAAVQYQSMLVGGIDTDAALESAGRIWDSGIDPELVAALVEAADLSKKTSKPSTNTATARKTPSRASTKATTSRKATPRTAPKKGAPRSSAPRSSGSGR